MELLVIGMGAGSKGHITQDAAAALRRCQAVIAFDKGSHTADLLGLRAEVLAACAPGVELIEVADPPRDRRPDNYQGEVISWHEARAAAVVAVLTTLDLDQAVGFLVWGDPSLYDSTLRIIDHMRPLVDIPLTVAVYPGITAVQALTAAFGITINRIGEPIHITTARMLENTDPALLSNCVVMLDGKDGWNHLHRRGLTMYWGAYLATDKQVLRCGLIDEIGGEVAQLKEQLRREHGWIMDTYLLRAQ